MFQLLVNAVTLIEEDIGRQNISITDKGMESFFNDMTSSKP